MPSTPTIRDPYDLPPPWWQNHVPALSAAAVFLLTVVLTVIAFPPYGVPEFAYTCLAPGVFWAYRRPAFRLYAWTMLVANALAWSLILGWLHHVSWFGPTLLGPVVGLWVGSWYLAAWWLMPRLLGRGAVERIVAVLGLAALWVVIEWTRTWLLGGFPWLPMAASQWQRVSILQIAAFTGAGGVSFVLVAMNIGFAAYAHRLLCEGKRGLQRRSQEFFACMFLLIVCVTIHVQETFNRGQFAVPLGRVALVQPYIPQMQKWDPAFARSILGTLEQTTLQAAARQPDLIIWPESTTPLAVRGDPQMQAWTEALGQRAKVPMLLGSLVIEQEPAGGETLYNGVLLVDPKTGVQLPYYAKRHLVPFGEYLPFEPILGWLRRFEPIGDNQTPGRDPQPLMLHLRKQPVPVGPLICYEDIFPNLAVASVRAGAEVLVVATNNAWFGEGGAAYQHAAHSILRAVETRRPVLRCGNGGWSGWIDEFGSIRAVIKNSAGSIYTRDTQTISVYRDARWIGRDSFYVLHGDWFVLVCGGWVILAYVLMRLGRTPVPEDKEAEPEALP